MNTQTKITGFALLLALFGLSYGLVAQSNAKASEEYLSLVQEKALLEEEKKAESSGWWVDEEAKNECIQSFTENQQKRQKNNEWRNKRIAEIDEQLDFLQSSQAQKKIKESEFIMIDTDTKTTDSGWFRKLLKWVGLS